MKYFYEKITDETLREIDEFLMTHPNDLVDYWSWRQSLELYVKATKELSDSVKEYGEQIDKILENFKPDDNDVITYINMQITNQKLAELRVISDQKVYEKLSKLEKKRYY